MTMCSLRSTRGAFSHPKRNTVAGGWRLFIELLGVPSESAALDQLALDLQDQVFRGMLRGAAHLKPFPVDQVADAVMEFVPVRQWLAVDAYRDDELAVGQGQRDFRADVIPLLDRLFLLLAQPGLPDDDDHGVARFDAPGDALHP